MHSSRNATLDRITVIAVTACAAFWLAGVVFFDVVSNNSLAPIGYAFVALTATIAALVASSSTRRRNAATARRVPRIPGGNSRFAYRPVSRHRGTVLMGSSLTVV
jgi:hypothetical protein